MTEIESLVDLMRRAHDGDPWYGPSLRQLLSGVTAQQASAHPVPSGHSIWEIVLHIAAWKDEARSRLGGRAASMPDAGDWPKVGETTEARWVDAKRRLGESHQALVEATSKFPAARLHERPKDERVRELGTGMTYYETLHGVLQHDVYHTAQIAMLKRALDTGK
ncbi:MAG TPA: DinB family protein [Gemmatimonadaceae bacterium]|nr:DinB family protein [Gemmatimonadaceae bacterium]